MLSHATQNTEVEFSVVDVSCVRQPKLLFTNISFTLSSGQALLIEGPNGSGKSSLLQLLSGLATPATGEIYWQNKLLRDTRHAFAENLHYIGHANGLKLGLTLTENLELSRHLALSPIRDIDPVLSFLGLSAYKNTPARYLSAGQKRKIALAKLFLFPKKLWILDEPFTTLDVTTQSMFLDELSIHLNNGGMAIISSHHPISLTNAQTLRLSSC